MSFRGTRFFVLWDKHGTLVISFARTIVVYKKGHALKITRLTPEEE